MTNFMVFIKIAVTIPELVSNVVAHKQCIFKIIIIFARYL